MLTASNPRKGWFRFPKGRNTLFGIHEMVMGYRGAGTLSDCRLSGQAFMHGWVQDGEAYLQAPASGETAIRF